jgi:hypothetical protein
MNTMVAAIAQAGQQASQRHEGNVDLPLPGQPLDVAAQQIEATTNSSSPPAASNSEA